VFQFNASGGRFMKSKILSSMSGALPLLLLVFASNAVAQEHKPVHFTGVLNDYTPADPLISGSPYEMHGQWSVDLREGDKADFYADMTMSDYATTDGVLDATKGGQNAHTHHIRLTGMKVTWDMTGCPAFSPATTMGFQFSGTVSLITGNGGKPPFDMTTPPTSTLTVCVTGGSEVSYSNMTMVFGGPAMHHFGTQAIHGVVRKAFDEDEWRERGGRHEY
jgi:hypothetical protein